MVWSLDFSHDSSVKSMSAEFCRKIADQKCEDNGDIFDANQSVFLSLLCDNVWAGDKYTSIVRAWDDSILKKTSFSQFNVFDYSWDGNVNYCDHKKSLMNGCDFSIHLPNIFDEIINDYFNINQARLYGVDWLTDDFDTEVYVNNFSNKHFNGLDICNPDSKFYKKSCGYLKDYMKNARNLLTKTKVIDVIKLTEQNKDIDCETEFADNLLYCGLLWDWDTTSYSFVNIIYNEYMRYRLFVSYYSHNLSKDPRYSWLSSSSNIDKITDNKEKVFTIQNQTFKIRGAINIALRSLSEISWSFPIHIGFVMYQEDANMFMKSLVKIYPPIRTLFDKFRNVQRAE
jgi:hypothetical protein